ncbi:MAG: hypothetical protein L3J82_03465 [Planctomycetes bacterium]|nr:hypothetical protein [Planctomycetota bacterium]
MAVRLIIRDDTLKGETFNELELEFESSEITVRELIRSRVFQEVKDYNAGKALKFCGLVQPKDSSLDGHRFTLPKHRKLDWEKQFDEAVKAFEVGRVIVLVNKKQSGSLDDNINLGDETDVAFLKLVALVGG